MKKTPAKKNQKTSIISFIISLIQSAISLYLVLAFVFILILAWSAASEPQVIQYLVTGKPALSFLTYAEAEHMLDVHKLIIAGMKLALIAIIALIALNAFETITSRTLRWSFYGSLALIAIMIPFPWTFVWFHGIFFPQGNWQFPANSWLITHFSETFFGIAAFTWLGLTSGTLYALEKLTK